MVLGREVVEGGEVIPVAEERLGRLVLAVLVEPDRGLVAAGLAGRARARRPDLPQPAAGLGPEPLRKLVHDVQRAMHVMPTSA